MGTIGAVIGSPAALWVNRIGTGLGVEEGADPFYEVVNFELPPEKAAGTIIQGEDDAAAAAAELVKLLRDEAKAI